MNSYLYLAASVHCTCLDVFQVMQAGDMDKVLGAVWYITCPAAFHFLAGCSFSGENMLSPWDVFFVNSSLREVVVSSSLKKVMRSLWGKKSTLDLTSVGDLQAPIFEECVVSELSGHLTSFRFSWMESSAISTNFSHRLGTRRNYLVLIPSSSPTFLPLSFSGSD